MKHICVITPRYPTPIDPTALTFVQQLVWSMAEEGIQISVICPLPVNINRKYRSIPDVVLENTYKGITVTVYYPKVWGFGQKSFAMFNTVVLTTIFFSSAVKRILKKFTVKPDALYGHFFAPAGITACKLGDKFGISSFVAYGESSPWSINHYGLGKVRKAVKNISGIIAVSSKNKKELCDLKISKEDHIKVFPNGYNPERFHPQNRTEARGKYRIPENAFVVAFVGHFIERKGINKLTQAIGMVENAYLICAGKGALKPQGEKVLYADLVSPDDLAWFYSAADIFVLPTKNEGCCNAIIEAMACGLPIVSSDLPFNYDVLDTDNSILIDPDQVDEIAAAINDLMVHPEKRREMAEKSLEKARLLTIQKRAQNILRFIEEKSGRV